MDIITTGRHTEVPQRFRDAAAEKLTKVTQLAPRAHRVDVELSHERNPRQSQVCKIVQITVTGKGPVVRAEASADDAVAALDLAIAKLFERLRRSNDRRKVHHGRQTPDSVRLNGTAAAAADVAAPAPSAQEDTDDDGLAPSEGDSPVVIRTKDHEAPPMTLDQALYEMELVGHDFFLFVDAGCSLPSVVYRRHGWNYGVIRLTTQAPLAASANDSPQIATLGDASMAR